MTELSMYELTDTGDSIGCLGHTPGEEVPHMDHVWPHFKGHLDTRSLGLFGQRDRVVEQEFGTSDVHQ